MARTIAKDHDKKRGLILSNAAKVFATEGFDRASMTQLAEACGISKANIYHYYDSKDAILYDILETYLSELRDLICGIDLAGLSPDERLYRAAHHILFAYQGSDYEHRVQIDGVGRLPEEQQIVLRGYQRDMVVFLGNILRDIAPDALGNDKVKLRSATMSVFGMLNWYYMWNSGAGNEAREAYAKIVADLTLNGLKGI
ncbi:MAG: TetR/AcrR family transcriptional regulator [Rhodobacter sp.]|nr:TetR/AcrR family transcriptional regulator [Rhodobacter sp.]